MNDDYLWDRSGEPDPDVVALERALGELRHKGTAPDVVAGTMGVVPFKARSRRRQAWAWAGLAAAAGIALVVVGLAVREGREPGGLVVVRIGGAPRIGDRALAATSHLSVGQHLETDASSTARIDMGRVGQVDVEANTRLALAVSRQTEQRLTLERGTIHARIWAPPRVFFVDTASATAVDLGCMYTLSVDPDGRGLLRVTQGWVAFRFGEREAFVPEGAVCATRAGQGPGTPYREDAAPELREALAVLDFEPDAGAAARDGALETLLASSRREDALTLWHRLARGDAPDASECASLYDRLAGLVPPPAGVTREGILARDQEMLDLWWDALGLQSAAFWRSWAGDWPPRAQ